MKRSALSLITLLIVLGFSSVQANKRSMNDQDDYYTENPKLGQATDGGFEEIIVNKTVFSESENYNKFNAFVIGMKLADDYLYVDECLDAVIGTVDKNAEYYNFMVYHNRAMEAGNETTYYKPYLFVTEVLAENVAESLDSCYDFIYDFTQRESERFATFGSSYGDFFLAFLFNQMGNALNFQAKFESIQDLRDSQNFVGVWQEYGDFVYLIWNFQPIQEASLSQVDTFVNQWFEDHQWLINEETVPVNVNMLKGFVSQGSKMLHAAGQAFGESVDRWAAKAAEKAEKRQE